MPFLESLRALTSVQGVPKERLEASLESVLAKALVQPMLSKQEAEKTAKRETDRAASEIKLNQGVFVTSASLTTFPVAAGVITVIWKLLQILMLNTLAFQSPMIPLVLALLLGAFLVYMALTDPKRPAPPTRRDIVVESVIGLINSLFLAAAVLGIDTAVLQ